jgi:hypothetical protein
MARLLLPAAIAVIVWPVFVPQNAHAQVDGSDDDVVVAQPAQQGPQPAGANPWWQRQPISRMPVQQVGRLRNSVLYPPMNPPGPAAGPNVGYATLSAPLYPCPQPFIPTEVGSTLITNQAFAPHEMLYPHCYCALYPPYYNKVRRSWVMTPLGIYKNERRVLTGTYVSVKYHGCIPPWTLFNPPCITPLHWFPQNKL